MKCYISRPSNNAVEKSSRYFGSYTIKNRIIHMGMSGLDHNWDISRYQVAIDIRRKNPLFVERGGPLTARFTENLVPGKTYQVTWPGKYFWILTNIFLCARWWWRQCPVRWPRGRRLVTWRRGLCRCRTCAWGRTRPRARSSSSGSPTRTQTRTHTGSVEIEVEMSTTVNCQFKPLS